MIRMKSGSTLVGNKLMNPSSGAFEAGELAEERLVGLGVAEYVDRDVATHSVGDKEIDVVVNTEKANKPENSVFAALEDTPMYSVESSVNHLRKIAKENGITFKVGTTKEEMVATLNNFFNEAPDLGVEDPVE